MGKASYKVMEISKWDDEIFYRVACHCGSADCDMHMSLMLDRKTGLISLLFEKKMVTNTDYNTHPVYFDLLEDYGKTQKKI